MWCMLRSSAVKLNASRFVAVGVSPTYRCTHSPFPADKRGIDAGVHEQSVQPRAAASHMKPCLNLHTPPMRSRAAPATRPWQVSATRMRPLECTFACIISCARESTRRNLVASKHREKVRGCFNKAGRGETIAKQQATYGAHIQRLGGAAVVQQLADQLRARPQHHNELYISVTWAHEVSVGHTHERSHCSTGGRGHTRA